MDLGPLRSAAIPFDAPGEALPALLEIVADARVVLIGEASHGTHEFYAIRAALTKALLESEGFTVVAVEADWPDAYRANCWVRARGADRSAEDALGDFSRFPRWMWRNRDVVDFLSWLRGHNARRPDREQAGFYGLDLYSMHTSAEAVLAYLDKVDPGAALQARRRYGCFEDFGADAQAYGYAATLRLSRSCEDDVVTQLIELRRRAAEYASRDGHVAEDEYFVAEQNARLVKNAEQYYRAMFGSRADSWNLRDTHMMETLDALLAHAGREAPARAVVWAHNSHIGDARATEMGASGELNLGQLARERFGAGAKLLGFTTHGGSVTAASNWDEPAARRRVRPSLDGSYERLFHDLGIPRFVLPLDARGVRDVLEPPRLERAIGVIYRPDTERGSHYFRTSLPAQFDAVIHIDETRALEPLERWSRHEADLPETYPSGI